MQSYDVPGGLGGLDQRWCGCTIQLQGWWGGVHAWHHHVPDEWRGVGRGVGKMMAFAML